MIERHYNHIPIRFITKCVSIGVGLISFAIICAFRKELK